MNKFLKAGLLIIALAALFCLGMLWLGDKGFNGFFKDWFYSFFDVGGPFSGAGKLGIIFSNWYSIKQFFVYLFFALIILLSLCAFVSAYFSAHHTRRRDISIITHVIESFDTPENEDARSGASGNVASEGTALKINAPGNGGARYSAYGNAAPGSDASRNDAHGNADLELPKEFDGIRAQLVRIYSDSKKQQQLVQSEMQRKNDLITYLAHDLKTPLASVIGYLSLLEEAQDMPAEQKAKYTGVALNKANRLEELINEFFDITRFNLQTIVLNKGDIKLAFMLHQMADEFYPLLAPQGRKVEIHVPESLVITGDADKLARVFNNILKNAIAYSYENSVIDISAGLQGEDVIITFENHGDPIPSQKIDTIFEKFYRLDSARSTDSGGAGLGLAIAKEIVTAHGGTITAESSMERTVFTVKLPH